VFRFGLLNLCTLIFVVILVRVDYGLLTNLYGKMLVDLALYLCWVLVAFSVFVGNGILLRLYRIQ
jgi:hypothetical protein